MTKPTTPAKITRPEPADSYPRARLFKWLERAGSKRCLWVMGPPGSGKTTLIADYLVRQQLSTIWIEVDRGDSNAATFLHFLSLAAQKTLPRRRRPLLSCTPERLQDLESFARDYFRDLYASFEKKFVLAFDNLHDIDPGSATLDILRLAIETLPENGQVIVLSRTEPPASFARLRLNGQLALLEDNALRLTIDEAMGIASKRLEKRPTRSRITALHELTHGWTAGLVLLLEQTDFQLPEPAKRFKTPGVLFEYFANEVFNKADADTRNVLLKSAFLPTMTVQQTAALSGERRAGRILNQLHRQHFFTLRYDLEEPVFQYQPLFREFLLSRASRLLDTETLLSLRRQAASLLETAGNTEAALDLYEEARDWSGYGRCISKQASQLLDDGRHEALEQWLTRLPGEALRNSPWLLYWDASARLTRHPQEGRARFEQAISAFAAVGDAHGARLAWCNIVNSIVHEGAHFDSLHTWIERFAKLPVPPAGPASTDAPVTASMLAALALTQPERAETRIWTEHAQNLLHSRADINKRLSAGIHLLYFHLYRGEMVRATSIANRLKEGLRAHPASPLMQLLTHISISLHDWLAGNHASSLTVAQQALALGESSGIRIWDNYIAGQAAAAELSIGNIDGAQLWLDRMALHLGNARPLDAGLYHALELWRALLRGDIPAAREQLNVLRQHERVIGLWFGEIGIHQAVAQAELAAGNQEIAGDAIQQILAGAEKYGSRRYAFIGHLLAAQQAFDQHRDTEGLDSLRQAMAIGREHRLLNFHGFLPRVIARLCARALEANIEAEHVRNWIDTCQLPVTDDARDLEAWPWPIRIYTFGRLSIINRDKPLKFSGRAQSRPLELLAALISHGGRGVAEEALSEQLWPDSEGDAAHRAFDITLHRLRKLIGNDEALVLSDSKLSINPSVCWVDVWTLERQLGRMDTVLRDMDSPAKTTQLERIGGRLLSLYRGPFLGSGEKSAWAVTTRERLHSKFLCQLNALAHYWERRERWSEAADLYQKAIDLQGHSEEYYHRLMLAYLNLQRPSDAMAVYRRARQTLSVSLGRTPSPALENCLQQINSALGVQ